MSPEYLMTAIFRHVWFPQGAGQQGFRPADLHDTIHNSKHMKEIPGNAQFYGETTYFPETINEHVIRWFDWDVTKLF